MTIDPSTLPDGAVVEAKGVAADADLTTAYVIGGQFYPFRKPTGRGVAHFDIPRDLITRVFVPVPEGMAYADAEAALADAGAWVELDKSEYNPEGARVRQEWTNGDSAQTLRRYVHRDDLPPADPDAELVEKMARAIYKAERSGSWKTWADLLPTACSLWRDRARAALAVVREHEALS